MRSSDSKIRIQVDEHSGVCPGVARAIALAETELKAGNRLASVGPVIHNAVEIERLTALGLKTVDQSIFENSTGWQSELANHKLLIRAHGISPALRKKLTEANFTLVDATCPKVVRSQKWVDQYARQGYKIIIIGKVRHAEVVGLVGCAHGRAKVILNPEDVEKIEPSEKTFLIAQTTIDINHFNALHQQIAARVPNLEVKNTICRAMQVRYQLLEEFAQAQDLILFVGGHNSSNTKVLYEVCRLVNSNSFHIEHVKEIDWRWFNGFVRVGIAGSASTPRWQLESVKSHLEKRMHP